MKKVGDLMAELGFRPEGSDSVKRAFIENLVRAAGQNRPRTSPLAEAAPQEPQKKEFKEEQLSFDFSSEPGLPFPFDRKRPTG